MFNFISTQRFAWLATARNTINELQITFQAPEAIAKELQGMITRGAGAKECNAVASASLMLREQIGA